MTDRGVLTITVTDVEIPTDEVDQTQIEGYFENRLIRLVREYNGNSKFTRPEIGGDEVRAEFIPYLEEKED